MIGYYLPPQIVIDPAIPVPQWSLSERGRGRIVSVLGKPWLQTVQRVISSRERKAVETAELIAAHLGLSLQSHDGLNENGRSATGFIPPEKFDAAADAFFA